MLSPTVEVSEGSCEELHEVMDAKVFCKIQSIPPMQAIIGRKQKDEFKSPDPLKMCERWPCLDCHPHHEFTDRLAISPSAHTRSLGDIHALCWVEQGEADSPKSGLVDSSSACRERVLVARRPAKVGSQLPSRLEFIEEGF